MDGPVVRIDADRRAHLVDRWTRIALMEHASIAAFARFNLQLLALGAPAGLVELTNRALSDETRHARQCFAIASAHAGRQVGPGPLSLEDATITVSLSGATKGAFLEGCIGETVAAAEAAWASRRAEGSLLQSVLDGIATDESEHARLAWSFVAWALRQDASIGTELRRLAAEARDRALVESAAAAGHDDDWIEAHGLVPAAVAKRIRIEVFEHVVMPCLEALIGAAEPRAAAA
jgi:hypothetical protein